MIHKSFLERRMRRSLSAIALAACALTLSGVAVASAGSAAGGVAGKPALWRTYDMIVNLRNLPRTYTCNELWYEFRGILLRLGAWPYSINILPYDCSPAPSGTLTSPNVQVRFQLPIFLPAADANRAPAQAVERIIRLSPGEPKSLQTSDCQLLQQISQTLLPSIEGDITAQHFDCSAPPRRAANFNVALRLPVALKIPAVATTSAPAPR